jgi:hypothetical protein
MGYYTNYVLSIKNIDNFDPAIELKVARALASLPYFGYTEDEMVSLENSHYPIDYVISYDCHKWYEHKDDMMKIAALFPECVFELDGIGEDPDDFWKEYYHGDKFQYCQGRRTYDPEPDWVK